MILSFHPMIIADLNRLVPAKRPPDRFDEAASSRAAAIILPAGCRRELWEVARASGAAVFPDYTWRFGWEGKVGNALLFRRFSLAAPRSELFASLEEARRAWLEGDLESLGRPPYVVKGAGGGEGRGVFLVDRPDDLQACGQRLALACNSGPSGLVVQEKLDTGGRDVRVVVMGPGRYSFWRRAPAGGWRTNLSQGGRLDFESEPNRLARAEEVVGDLCRLTGINLAAVDVLAPAGGPPRLLEINYFFGRRAFGGSEYYFRYLLLAVRFWLVEQGLDPSRARLYGGD